MDELSRDERMRSLQRLAYGAVASDAERAAALAELEELRREREAARVTAAADAEASVTEPNAAAVSPLVVAQPESTPDRMARPLKWAIATGTAALLVGVAVGWQLAARTALLPEDQADQALGASAAISLGPSEVVSVPVAGSSAIEVFDRPQVEGDIPPAEQATDAARALDTSSYRLLITRPDGVTLHAFRAENGVDVCMMVVVPDLGIGAACTGDGSFPGEGLTQELYLQGQGLIRAAWNADGSALISAPPSR